MGFLIQRDDTCSWTAGDTVRYYAHDEINRVTFQTVRGFGCALHGNKGEQPKAGFGSRMKQQIDYNEIQSMEFHFYHFIALSLIVKMLHELSGMHPHRDTKKRIWVA